MGVIESSEYLFPEYLKKYTNFAISIARVSALVFSNAKQYEDLEKLKDERTYTSYHDSLTGLYNRNYYTEYINSNELPSGVVLYMCDLDGLKGVNDNLGHIYGDELIRMAADVLRESFRETDIIARIGGDEFAVIQQVDDFEVMKKTKERIEKNIAQKNLVNLAKRSFTLSISVGFATKKDSHKSWREMEEESDTMMYAEKNMKKQKILESI
jgi:diguanylate cyclase (GGDEF)-like protein